MDICQTGPWRAGLVKQSAQQLRKDIKTFIHSLFVLPPPPYLFHQFLLFSVAVTIYGHPMCLKQVNVSGHLTFVIANSTLK